MRTYALNKYKIILKINKVKNYEKEYFLWKKCL